MRRIVIDGGNIVIDRWLIVIDGGNRCRMRSKSKMKVQKEQTLLDRVNE